MDLRPFAVDKLQAYATVPQMPDFSLSAPQFLPDFHSSITPSRSGA